MSRKLLDLQRQFDGFFREAAVQDKASDEADQEPEEVADESRDKAKRQNRS